MNVKSCPNKWLDPEQVHVRTGQLKTSSLRSNAVDFHVKIS